jgi:hypothetical protein
MGERFRAPDYESCEPEPTPDLDRLEERLKAEKFDPRTTGYSKGRIPEIESWEYPEWYEQGRKLLEIIDGRRIGDEQLRGLAEHLGFDLDEILGRSKDDDESNDGGPTVLPRIERGRG